MKEKHMFYINELYRRPQQRKPGLQKIGSDWCRWRCVYNYIDSYWSLSTFHGFRHFTAVRHHWTEYIFWVIFIMFAIIGTSYLSFKSWNRNQHYPTVNTIDREINAWPTILPSIMICPKNKLDPHKLQHYISQFPVINQEEIEMFITELAPFQYNYINSELKNSDLISPDNYMSLLYKLRFEMRYRVEDYHLNSEFISEIGICHVFNSILSHHHTPEMFFGETKKDVNISGRLISGRPLTGDILAVIIDINTPYTAQFSEPTDIPDLMAKRYEGRLNSYLTLEMKGLSTVSTEGVRALDINQRKCRLPEESNLSISSVYSYNLCRINCRRILALELCKCAPHFYPKLGNTPVCDVDGLRCLTKYKDLLMNLMNPDTQEKVNCECMTACDQQLNYVVESKIVPWFMGTTFKWSIEDFPKMRIKREVIFGTSDLLVSIGGIAGLCLGCSLLSFIEILYFFTLRLFFTLKIKYGTQINSKKLKSKISVQFFNKKN